MLTILTSRKHAYVILTPHKTPLLYSKTGVYRGMHYFLFPLKTQIVLAEAVLTSTHNLCSEQKYKKIDVLSENFQFLEVKFSIYLNRRVFVMKDLTLVMLKINMPRLLPIFS